MPRFARTVTGGLLLVVSVIMAVAAVEASVHGRPTTLRRRRGGETVTPACADPSDCTAELQAALNNATVSRVVLTAARSPWVSLPLTIERSHVDLVVDAGALLLAKRWAFNASGASLLSIVGCDDVTLSGGGTLRMWRSDYNNPKWYRHAEWRMALRLLGVRDVVVDNVTLEESGGDGIYVSSSGGAGSDRAWCDGVILSNVRSHNNYRQGISVISAKNLDVVNSTFDGTKGTPPMAGVDFEPDYPWQALSNIRFDSCLFRNNTGFGAILAAHAFDTTSLPVDIAFTSCVFDANHDGSFGVSVPLRYTNGGNLTLDHSEVYTTRGKGFLCFENPEPSSGGVAVRVGGATAFRHNVSSAESAIDLRAPCSGVSFEAATVAMLGASAGSAFMDVRGPFSPGRTLTGSFNVSGTSAGACEPVAAPGFNFTVECAVV